MDVRRWRVDVFLSEEGDSTRARAVLHTDDARSLEASGTARRDPHDPQVAEIGDEIAAGRALRVLAESLLHRAEQDIGSVTGEHPYVHR